MGREIGVRARSLKMGLKVAMLIYSDPRCSMILNMVRQGIWSYINNIYFVTHMKGSYVKNYILGVFVVLLLAACGSGDGGDGGDGGGASSGSSSKEQLNRNFEVCDITLEGEGSSYSFTLNPLPSSTNLHIGKSVPRSGTVEGGYYALILIFDDGILNLNTYDTNTNFLWYIVSAADCSYSVLSSENRVSAGPYYIVLINPGSSDKVYRYEITLNAAS